MAKNSAARKAPAHPHQADRRTEPRAGIALLRAAKLVCANGEAVCLLRDVTSEGVRLRFFHEVPADTHVLLERASGETHALLRVWAEERDAGYRFAQAVVPEEFIGQRPAEAAAELMLRVSAVGLVHARGATQPATLRAIGQRGAVIHTTSFLALGQPLTLAVEGISPVGGWVRWRNGEEYGVIFEAMHRLDELAARVRMLNAVHADATPAVAGAA